MEGKELFLKAMSYSKNLSNNSKNNIENEANSEWDNWDYHFQNNLEITVSSTESSTVSSIESSTESYKESSIEDNITENLKSSSSKILHSKNHPEKDFGTLKVLTYYPNCEEYKTQIENARFLSKKKCLIYKKLNKAQRKDIHIFAKNNKMRHESYGHGNNKFIAIWGAKES